MSGAFAVCVIVKDEARFLAGCLEPLAAAAEQIVVVDTGSSDGTIDIAREFTDDVLTVEFGGDFSRARNSALAHVRAPWVVFLDADERFDERDAWSLAPLLAQAPNDVLAYEVLRYNLFSTGGWYSTRELKVFRNDPRIRYERRINESVRASVERAGGRVDALPLLLNHFGHCRPRAERDAKAHRYMRLMREQLREHPRDPLLVAYLGLILRTLGRFADALAHANAAVAAAPADARVRLFQGHVLRSTGDDAAARDAYESAISLAPDDAAAWNMLGVQQLALGRCDLATAAFEHAWELEPLPHLWINKGLAAQADGAFERAVECFDRAAAANPAFLHDEWAGRVECDPFRALYYETVMQYAGLGYHRAYCASKLVAAAAPVGSGSW